MLWKQHRIRQSHDFCHEDDDWWWSVVMFRFAQLLGYHPRLIVNLAFSPRPDILTACITLLHICTHLDPLKTTRLVDVAQAGNNLDKKKRTAQMMKSNSLNLLRLISDTSHAYSCTWRSIPWQTRENHVGCRYTFSSNALKFLLRRCVNIMQQTKAKQCKFLDMFIIWYPGRLLGHKGQGNGLTRGPKYLTRVKHSEL